MGSSRTILLLALACYIDAKPLLSRSSIANANIICNHAWSNSGADRETDCAGADWILSSPNDGSDVVVSGLASSNIKSMASLSVNTVGPDLPVDNRLADYLRGESATPSNSRGGVQRGTQWFKPEDLLPHILPIMKDIIDEYKARGFNAITAADAESPIATGDIAATRDRAGNRIDARYVEYLHAIVDYAHSIGMKVALKNPSLYFHETDLVEKFDAYLIESLFNWYPYDINKYKMYSELLTGSKPVWIFQYEGVNGLSNSVLRERMAEQGVNMTYLDTEHGWINFYA